MTRQDEADGARASEIPERGRVTAERLSGIDEWEMYRFFDVAAQEPVCSVALRVGAAAAGVEYAVWREREDGEEPGATGTIDWQVEAAPWDDAAREEVLRQVAYRYEEDLAVSQDQLVFRPGGALPEDLDDDEEDSDEEEDDDEGANDDEEEDGGED